MEVLQIKLVYQLALVIWHASFCAPHAKPWPSIVLGFYPQEPMVDLAFRGGGFIRPPLSFVSSLFLRDIKQGYHKSKWVS
jgi:hypothetical protein